MQLPWAEIGLVLLLVVINAGFAGSEVALISLREGQLRRVPIYDFRCVSCGAEFEELVAVDAAPECPVCGSAEVVRRWSPLGTAGAGLETKGRAARESNARRSEREAARKERFVAERKSKRDAR